MRTWIAGTDTDAVVLESIESQLRSAAERHSRLRLSAPIVGIAPVEAIPEFYQIRWGWLLAEYAGRVFGDAAATERAARSVGGQVESENALLTANAEPAA